MKVGHFHLHVASVEKTVDFYTEYFGFQNLNVDEQGNAFLRDEGGLDFVVSPLEDRGPVSAATHIGFRQESPEAVKSFYDKLQGNAEVVGELMEQEGFSIFSINDPNGMLIEVYYSVL
jgi:catechol 2,3-dioxygenase-like lactoylglutathione lyase family enzyme